MDKKNTILLTVIAVATLLVAVIGATFAYYSVQVKNESSKVNANVKTSAVGVLTLSTPKQHLYLNVTPEDMANLGQNTSYYATDSETSSTTISNKNTQRIDYVISQLAVNGGVATTNYTCKATLRVTLHTGADSMGAQLQTGDVKLYLTSENVQTDETGTVLNATLDLHNDITDTLEAAENTKIKDYTIYYKVNGGTKNTASIKAALELINKAKTDEDGGDQRYLAGKDLVVDIDVITGDTLDCSIDAATTD